MRVTRNLLLAGSSFGAGAAAAVGALRSRKPAPEAPAPEPGPYAAHVDPLLARELAPWPAGTGPVSDGIYARLLPEDIEALEHVVEGVAADYWHHANDELKRRLAVVLTTHYGIEGATERTGLLPAMPPEEIHSMARGPLAAGGDPYTADLIVESLQRSGFVLDEGATVLDFGCSSARVLRPLHAWRPDLDLLGCDPNQGAISWAQEHLPIAKFFVSGNNPPLELRDASVDIAYAISIWSHFDAPSAIAWLEEMHRIIRPGGALFLTTHGVDTLARYMRDDLMTHESASTVARSFLSSGHHWYDVFGEDGDWGVKSSGWGNGYMTLDWLATRVTPQWAIRLFIGGGLDQNQDVIVLERR